MMTQKTLTHIDTRTTMHFTTDAQAEVEVQAVAYGTVEALTTVQVEIAPHGQPNAGVTMFLTEAQYRAFLAKLQALPQPEALRVFDPNVKKYVR